MLDALKQLETSGILTSVLSQTQPGTSSSANQQPDGASAVPPLQFTINNFNLNISK